MADPIYQIHVDYRTGDSDKHWDTEMVLEMEWRDLDKAKAALKRIEEHYRWYDGRDSYEVRYNKKAAPVEPAWHRGLDEYSIILLLDNDAPVKMWCQWCGYFEKLYGAKIIVKEPEFDGLSFTYDRYRW